MWPARQKELPAPGIESKSRANFVVMRTSKVVGIFVGEIERHRRMTTGLRFPYKVGEIERHRRMTTGVNFTNVLRAAFMYVSCARSFFVLTS
jgi:hypothetical protein